MFRSLLYEKSLGVFLIVTGFFSISLLIATFVWGYQESFLILNALRIPILDDYAPFFTEFGNGFYVSIFALLLACAYDKYWKVSLEIILCVLVTALIVHFCKQVLFSDWHRPAKLLRDKSIHVLLSPVPEHNSFPSGHSITIMSACTVLSTVSRNFLYQFFLGVAACLIAYTRIYVGAHFPADVAVGSFMGLIISMIVLYFLRNFDTQKIEKNTYVRYGLYIVTVICLLVALLSQIDIYNLFA
ncbi:MAG: phosphatase PAP2 family protein [Bacteroidia bacterium]|nr:phosphatase PAP2 family protein [Bacteroidia bacterium]MDW8345581.1 phosphatase PAP2 family protein [Bacteroidia bacterium]